MNSTQDDRLRPKPVFETFLPLEVTGARLRAALMTSVLWMLSPSGVKSPHSERFLSIAQWYLHSRELEAVRLGRPLARTALLGLARDLRLLCSYLETLEEDDAADLKAWAKPKVNQDFDSPLQAVEHLVWVLLELAEEAESIASLAVQGHPSSERVKGLRILQEIANDSVAKLANLPQDAEWELCVYAGAFPFVATSADGNAPARCLTAEIAKLETACEEIALKLESSTGPVSQARLYRTVLDLKVLFQSVMGRPATYSSKYEGNGTAMRSEFAKFAERSIRCFESGKPTWGLREAIRDACRQSARPAFPDIMQTQRAASALVTHTPAAGTSNP